MAPIWFPHCPAWMCTISRILMMCWCHNFKFKNVATLPVQFYPRWLLAEWEPAEGGDGLCINGGAGDSLALNTQCSESPATRRNHTCSKPRSQTARIMFSVAANLQTTWSHTETPLKRLYTCIFVHVNVHIWEINWLRQRIFVAKEITACGYSEPHLVIHVSQTISAFVMHQNWKCGPSIHKYHYCFALLKIVII